jgi:hypothetical protein
MLSSSPTVLEATGDPVGDAPGRTVVGRVGDENNHDCRLPKEDPP